MPAHEVPLLDTVDIRTWVDRQADAFDQAWQVGPPPRIRDFIDQASSDRRLPLLHELIMMDLEYRWKSGERPSLDAYLNEFSAELVDANHSDMGELKSFAAKLQETPSIPMADDSLPRVIGNYQVVRELGRGAQSIVYHAFDTQLGKAVIIKLSKHPIQPTATERDRIVNEGEILAGLNHPHIPKVLCANLHQGRPFFVMEYANGRNLEQYLDQDNPERTKVAILLAKVARALAAAHGAGVTHQDLKPHNILVDDAGEPRVIDFGLARIRHGWHEDKSAFGCTIIYTSPEQALGDLDRIQPHSDIFALGAVLYRVLVGTAPFEAANYHEALRKAQACDFDRDALRKDGVPQPLAAICLRAMEKNPKDRYATADDFAKAVERAANPPKYGRWILSAGTLLLLAVGFAAWWFGWGPFAKPPDLKPLIVAVHRERIRPRPLTRAVPLRPGDAYRVEAEIPTQVHTALYFVDATGHIERLQDFEPAETPHFISYPASRGDPPEIGVRLLDGPSGTVFILAVGKGTGPITDEEVRELLDVGDKLPELPDDSVIRVRKDSVEAVGDSEDSPRGNPVRYHIDQEAALKQRLDAVRQRLLERGFSYIEGYAFRQPARFVED